MILTLDGPVIHLRSDVTLGPLGQDAATRMYDWMCTPAVAANLGLRSQPTPEKTRDWIRSSIDDPTVQAYAILRDGGHVGNVVLDQIDSYLSCARFSIYVGEPAARGLAVGLTAGYRALSEGFDTLKLSKVWLTVHTENIAALHTYRALGFMLEGTHRQEFRLNNILKDVFYMGLLRDEFNQLEPQVLAADS